MSDDDRDAAGPGGGADESGGRPDHGPAGPAAAAGDAREYLTRSRTDRLVAGVCGGLGRHFGVDPIVFRVVVAATTLLGGVGLLLYGLAWLVLPEEGGHRSAARGLMAGHVDHRSFAAGVLLVMGVAVFFAYVDDGFGRAVPLLAVSAIVLFLTWSENRRRPAAGAHTGHGTAGSGGHLAASHAGHAATVAAGPRQTAGEPAPGGAGDGGTGPNPGTGWWKSPPPPERPAEPRGPRSYLAIGVVCLAVAVAGLLSLVASAGGADISAQVVLAVMLAVLGAGLLVGTFFGRARLLLIPAVPVTAALVALSAMPVPFEGPAGDRRWVPRDAAAVSEPYRMKAGDLDMDLRRLDLGPAGSRVRVVATIGAGRITVTVPYDVRVEIRGRAGAGAVDLPDGRSDGLGVDDAATLDPVREPSRGTITLDVRVGVGEVEVFRAAA